MRIENLLLSTFGIDLPSVKQSAWGVGIALPKDMAKLKVYNPDKKSNFGSRYTLFKEGLVKTNSPRDQLNAANHMKETFKMLVDQYSAVSGDEVEEYEL